MCAGLNEELAFAERWWVAPLRGMARDTVDDDVTNELVAFIAEEAQSFSGLVAVLVQGLVTIIRNSGVWARVIFHCSRQIENTSVMLKCFFLKSCQTINF